jgi:pimeloyl-ACP methyl ester carboxylesterase
MDHRLHGFVAAALLLAGCGADQAPSASRAPTALQFDPCTLASTGLPYTVSARCTTVEVPEDRARPGGRTLQLAVAVVPATARRARPDPVFMLAGGPGQSARESFPSVAGAFRDVLRERDVVLVDQRGTGASNPLACRDVAGENAFTEGDDGDIDAARRFAEKCLAELDGDPRFYTTSEAVRDLDDVRKAIGAAQLNLVGISYGTRVAQEYLRRFPERARTVVLDSIVPPELALGSEHARNLDAALEQQFARCEGDALCASRFGAPMAKLRELLERARTSPARVEFRHPLTHELLEEPLTAEAIAGVARLYAYVPQFAAMLPMSLAEAAAGRPQTLLAQRHMIESLVGEQIMHGMQLSVGCSEDADFLETNPADATTVMGTGFIESILAQCAVWPRGARPADFHEPVRSDVPVLLMSGEFDPVTPPRYGEQVLRTLPNGRHLVARGQGHNVMTAGCLPRLMARFVATADARGLDAGCMDQLVYTPPFTGAYGWEP